LITVSTYAVEVAGRGGLRRARPHELDARDVVEARLRDVDVVLVHRGARVVHGAQFSAVAAHPVPRKRAPAQEHLTTATTMYREMGMVYWLEQAEAEMRALA
jgi:hypothetical protein